MTTPDRFPTTILLATDGSADAASAARVAVDLADRAGAALHVAHAWMPAALADPLYPGLPPLDYGRAFEGEARALLDEQVGHLAAAGGRVTGAHLRLGRPADEVVALARDLGADLVVAGSRGRSPLQRLVLGSVSEGLVHHAPCPILVVRGGEGAWPPARVVIGDDGSADAARAAGVALQIGRLVGAEAILVAALPEPPATIMAATGEREAVLRPAEAALADRGAELEARTGHRPRSMVATGEPAATLLQAAEAHPGPALIAVGSRGLGMIARLRLGSVSTKVLHAARWPVLVVPPRPR